MSDDQAENRKHGGRREGAGRLVTYTEPTIRVTIRVYEREVPALEALGDGDILAGIRRVIEDRTAG